MSEILLPRRFTSQPQYPAPLDKANPLYPYILFAWSAGRGLQDGRHPEQLGSYVGTVNRTVALNGRAVIPADNTSYVQFGDIADYNQRGNITVVARIRSGGTTVQQGLVTKCETSGGANTPFGFFTEAGGSLSLNRANGAVSGFRVWSSAAIITAGNNYVLAASSVADISVAPTFYINGVKDTGAPTSLYSGAGTGAATGNTTSLKIGNRTDLASQSFHDIHDVVIFSEVLSDATIRRLNRELDSIWLAQPRRLWAIPAAGGTAALTGQALTSAQGTLAPATSKSITGQSLTGAQGTLAPTTSKTLTGQSLTSAQGTLAPSTSVALTGQSLTSAQGTISVSGSSDVTLALSGQALTSAQGTLGLTKSGSVALSGQQATTAQGTLAPATAVAVSGQSLTSSQGTLAPATSVALSGQALTGYQGSLSPSAAGQSITIQLTGQTLTPAQGSLSLDQYLWDTTQGRAQPGRGTFRPLKPDEMSKPEIVVVDIPEEESTYEHHPVSGVKPTRVGPRAGISGIKLPPQRRHSAAPTTAQNRDYKALMAIAGTKTKTMKLSDFPVKQNKKYLTKIRGPVTLKGN